MLDSTSLQRSGNLKLKRILRQMVFSSNSSDTPSAEQKTTEMTEEITGETRDHLWPESRGVLTLPCR